ncbi:MAG: hypothetical protein GXY08_00500 [Ruminococcus sp.]|nr:hypothetical protein [Ruminococcus sp.]
MGKDFKKKILTIALIIGFGLLIWCGLKWFGGVADNNAGKTYDGVSKYEEQVQN